MSNPLTMGFEGGQYQPLSEEQIEIILEASFSVLEGIGIEVLPSPCLEVWRNAGAVIDRNRNRVFVPRKLVQQTLETAASQVHLYGQSPEHDLVLGGKRVYMGTGGAAIKVLDLVGQVRTSQLQDLYDIGRLVDTLDNIHFYHRPVVALDVPGEIFDINTYYACLCATQKHVMGACFTPDGVRQVIELAGIIARGEAALKARPIISFTNSWMISPLRYATESVATLDEIVRQGFPVAISSAPQAGVTSPVALAGTLVQLTAEQLSGLTYINLIRPGHPVILGYVPAIADLRLGIFSGGGPEFAMMNAASAQLSQRLNIPVYVSSAVTDSKLPDIQAGYEKGYSSAVTALAGANYIHHSAGMLESLLAVAYEQYVIDDEINAAVLRMVRGIEVTDETLSIEVID